MIKPSAQKAFPDWLSQFPATPALAIRWRYFVSVGAVDLLVFKFIQFSGQKEGNKLVNLSKLQ